MSLTVAPGRALYALRSGVLTRIDGAGSALPPAPTITSITEPEPGAVRIEWTAVAGATEYRVYETNSAANGPVAVVAAPTTWRQSGSIWAAGETPDYWVTAVVGGVESAPSEPASITIVGAPVDPDPEPPATSLSVKYARPVEPLADPATDPAPTGWNKYVFESPTQYRKNGGALTGLAWDATTLLLDAGTDNIVYLPKTAPIGAAGFGVPNIQNGRNLVVFGGHVEKSNHMTHAQWMDPTVTQSNRRGIQFAGQTGDVYVEGVLVDGEYLTDGIWANLGTSSKGAGVKRYVTFQNCIMQNLHTPHLAAQHGEVDPITGDDWSPSTPHPDGIQFMGSGTDTEVRLYQVIIRTAYQGLMDNTGGGGPALNMERVHVDVTVRNDDGSLDPGYPFYWARGGAITIGPDVSVHHVTENKPSGGQRRPGYPESRAEWNAITQTFGPTNTDPAWAAPLTSGTNRPGLTYDAAQVQVGGSTPPTPTFTLGVTEPNATNTGPRYAATETINGTVTLSTPGQVFERKTVNGRIVINADNVVIRDVTVNAAATTTNHTRTINVNKQDAQGVVIEYTRVQVPSANRSYHQAVAIGGRGFTARHCDLANHIDGIVAHGVVGQPRRDVRVEACYIHDLFMDPADPNQSDGSHCDAVNAEGYCNLEVIGSRLHGYTTSCLIVTNNVAGGYNYVRLLDSWLYGHPTLGSTVNVVGINVAGLEVKRNRVDRNGRHPRLIATADDSAVASKWGMVGATGSPSGWTATPDANVFMDGGVVPVSNG